MEECEYCKDFNEESGHMEITEIAIKGTYFFYDCPIRYCPNCGKLLVRLQEDVL